MNSPRWMIYGASGYTGRLIAEEAVRRGHAPTLAGRSRAKLAPLAEALGLPFVVATLEADELEGAIAEHALVLNAAGPFVHTVRPVLRACLDARAHYLDITGEVPALEHAFAQHAEALERGVAIIPAVGFDVVPTDCLARYVAEQVGTAEHLEIAFAAIGRPSGGTLRSALEALPTGGFVRRAGALVSSPLAGVERRIPFPGGEWVGLAVPWGDVVTAFQTTGAANITAYLALRPAQARLLKLAAPLGLRALRGSWAQAQARRLIERLAAGPSEAERAAGRSLFFAEARNRGGDVARAWLESVEGYRMTQLTAVRAVEQTLGLRSRGALTPALAFGADFVLQLPETRRLDRVD